MHTLALWLIGFSICSVPLLVLTHFAQGRYQGQRFAQVMGVVLLLVLAGLQIAHYAYLQDGSPVVHSGLYHVLLFAVAPCFYLFSQPLLLARGGLRVAQWPHAVPLLLVPWLPSVWALPLAFALGAGYLLWLGRSIYALRSQRSHFRLELWALGLVFVIAVLVMLLGLAVPLVPEQLFFTLYASAIGAAFLLISAVLGYAPQLPVQVSEAARATYAVSTLGSVDCPLVLRRLDALMCHEQVYRSPELDLPLLAGKLELSTHQLSELLNVHLGKGFARFVREHRVVAAKTMLLAEPSASVLSVGLSVGFTSQSNFYEAFREIVGMTPGQFRKVSLSHGKSVPKSVPE